MGEISRAVSGAWTQPVQTFDTLVVSCLAAVALTGMVTLSPPVPPRAPDQPEITTTAMNSAVLPRPGQEMFYPWTAPESYKPVLPEPKTPAKPLIPQEPFLTRLETPGADKMFYASTHDVKDSHYGCNWRAENVEPTPSGALLAIHNIKGASQPCTAAEMQTGGQYSYGRYEVIMRPARGSGTVSSFFTYTGSWFGDPHDEIDIEFLGKDTTKVHFNYFRKGQTGADEVFDLPFDAADADRLYAFEWTPEGITWFVEGVPYYTTPVGDAGLPVAPGRIYMNVWAGEPWIEAWTGSPTYRSGTGAHYSCVSYVPLGGAGPSCGDNYTPPAVLSP